MNYLMKTFRSYTVYAFLFWLMSAVAKAQSCSDAGCDADVYTVDLSAAPEGIWQALQTLPGMDNAAAILLPGASSLS